MKKVVLSCALLGTAFAGFSQTSIEPEVGVNFANLSYKNPNGNREQNDALTGIRAGVGVNFGINKNLYFKPGVYFSAQGTKAEALGFTNSHMFSYIQVPLNIGYRYEISDKAGAIFGEVGPYVGFAISGKTNLKGNGLDNTSDLNLGTNIDEYNPLDFGVNVGLGYETPWGVYIKGGYGLGLGNMSNVEDAQLNNRVFNVSLGYKINL